MKHMKKWLALALALVLALALSAQAFALTYTWDMLKNGFDYNGEHYKGNRALAEEQAYTPESARAVLDAYQAYQDAPAGSKEEKDAYDAFKEAVKNLKFKAHSFTDAPRTQWYTDALDFVAATGEMNGVGQGLFDPQGTMTRAMAVTVLWRVNGSPAPKSSAGFTDVPAGQWYSDAIAWAVENKITNGKTASTFDPNSSVTREQMATFFSRMMIAKITDNDLIKQVQSIPAMQWRILLRGQYKDANQISEYALMHIGICLKSGVMKGNADGTFAPQANITRAQGAQMLLNYYDFLISESFRKV